MKTFGWSQCRSRRNNHGLNTTNVTLESVEYSASSKKSPPKTNPAIPAVGCQFISSAARDRMSTSAGVGFYGNTWLEGVPEDVNDDAWPNQKHHR